MRRPVVVGNWKMNNTIEEAESLTRGVIEALKGMDGVEIIICPPYTALFKVMELINGTNIMLGAQNLFHQPKGPYTGEISPIMLRDIGCRYVIIGHSERRIHLREDDETINKKVKASLDHGLIPILCVGERLDDRRMGLQEEVVLHQLSSGLNSIGRKGVEGIIIAYEPVWAIGTGVPATPQDAERMHLFIRKRLSKMYDEEIASILRILYGGSVDPGNIEDLIREPDIDGVLVGGASLDASSFSRIVRSFHKLPLSSLAG